MIQNENKIGAEAKLKAEKCNEDFERVLEKMRVLHREDDIDRR